jgi:hypothetical protein
MRHAIALAALLAVALSGCGGDRDATRGPTATTAAAGLPALARTPPRTGELVFSGEVSPRSHGPFALDGRYVVRFEQFAPENPKLDFSGQTPFTARLRRAGSRGGGEALFGSAAARGRRELAKHGRYVLDVSFGDFPYAVRFTPERQLRAPALRNER